MKIRLWKYILMSLGLSNLISCAKPQNKETQDHSRLHYISFGPGVTGLTARVKQKQINVCLSGMISNQIQWGNDIKKSILTWVEPFRRMTSDPLVRDIIIDSPSGECDVKINASPGAWAMTQTTEVPYITMGSSGYFASYNVLLHEFGHAFGLSDTYSGGQSGNCQPGQPQSVMCNTSFSELQKDDLDGLKEVFSYAFPNDTPGTFSAKMFAKISDSLSEASGVKIEIAISGAAGASISDVQYCLGDKFQCENDQGSWITSTSKVSAPSMNGSPIFEGKDLIFPDKTPIVTLKSKVGNELILQSIKFKKN